jgi:predicted O-methyltransferase YrrM
MTHLTPLAAEYRRRAVAFSDIRVQMPVLYAWAHLPAVRIIELGVRGGVNGGNSTCAFLAGIEHAGADGRLWSADIARPDVPAEWLRLPHWELLVADALSEEAREFFPAEADILFSDTSHLYGQVYGELEAYAPRIRPGGIILVHDTQTPGTDQAWPDVPRALDAWCAAARLEWYCHPDWNGLGVIEIPL